VRIDYTDIATVHHTVRYHAEGLDAEAGEWIRVQPTEGGGDGAEDGFVFEINAIAYAATIRKQSGCKVRIVEEITTRVSRTVMEQ
jgi:hypothetical protein